MPYSVAIVSTIVVALRRTLACNDFFATHAILSMTKGQVVSISPMQIASRVRHTIFTETEGEEAGHIYHAA